MSSGTIGARLSVDASNIRRLVGDSLALMVRSTVTVLAGFFYCNSCKLEACPCCHCSASFGGSPGISSDKVSGGIQCGRQGSISCIRDASYIYFGSLGRPKTLIK